jgi:hypothetical protein
MTTQPVSFDVLLNRWMQLRRAARAREDQADNALAVVLSALRIEADGQEAKLAQVFDALCNSVTQK